MYPYINIFGRPISSYGICMCIAYFLVTFLTAKRSKAKNICGEDIIVVAACVLGMALLGGGLLYIAVTYSIDEIMTYIKNGDFDTLLTGGIVFYGGLIGGIAGAFLGGRIAKINITDIEVPAVPLIPLGHAIGRIGCLLAGCCYGIPYNGPLAVCYTHSIFGLPPDVSYFPVQALEAFLDIFIMFYLLHYAKKSRKKYDVLFTYLLMYAVMRFITEMFRGDAFRGIFASVSTSQWISIGLVILYFARLIFNKAKKQPQ